MTGKTMAEHAREYRTRKAERIARMEAALEKISKLPVAPMQVKSAEVGAGVTIGRREAAGIAIVALAKLINT